MSEKLKLLLLFGGQSCEHEVSVTSARSMIGAIDPDRYEPTMVGIAASGRWRYLEDPSVVFHAGRVGDDDGMPVFLDYCDHGVLRSHIDTGFVRRFDVAFPLLHGPRGEDGTVQGLFELAGMAYVGSGVVGSAVAMDKQMMRRAFAAEGLAQTEWVTVTGSAWRDARRQWVERCTSVLGFPVFVKPCNLGSSVGVRKAHDAVELADAIDFALRFDYKAMVERSVEQAREIECAVLGNSDPRSSPLGEIIPGAEFYNYETKYLDDKSRLLIPAPLDDETTSVIREIAVRAFQAVEAFGLARVDFLVRDVEPRVVINEINTMPGFTPISMYPKLWQQAGMSYAGLIDHLIELAMERHAECASLSSSL